MRYSQLKAFHDVALHGGFSRAAEVVRQAQPALSEHVRRLEQDYDVLLFHRDRKHVRLTPTGEDLFVLTKRLFEVEHQIGDFLSESRAALDGTLRIIVDSAHHVTDTLRRFQGRHPHVFVSLRTGNTEDVLSALRTYDAEIGIIGSVGPGREFDVLDLGATPIIAIAARGYVPAGTRPLSLRELAAYPLVFREQGSKTRQKLEEEAARQRVVLTPAIEVEGREAMREVVAAGAGIGFLSEAEFGDDARLVKVALRDVEMAMSETMVYLAQRRDLRLIRAFMDLAPRSGGTASEPPER
jgi:aminoethylphosphonate catabolism LysR family transcriptional regulator